MQRDSLQTAVFRQPPHLAHHEFLIVPAGAEFASQRDFDGGANCPQDVFDLRQIAEQPGTAIALHNFLHRAAEVDVDKIETKVFADACRFRHDLGIRPE